MWKYIVSHIIKSDEWIKKNSSISMNNESRSFFFLADLAGIGVPFSIFSHIRP